MILVSCGSSLSISQCQDVLHVLISREDLRLMVAELTAVQGHATDLTEHRKSSGQRLRMPDD